jgi:hypothetical protein
MDARAGQGSVAKASLMAGVITAIVVSTPYLDKVNACCCVLVVAGGLLAAWILQSDSAGTASTGRCGVAGLLAGFVGGVLGVPLTALVSRLAYGVAGLEENAETLLGQARQAMEGAGPLPPGFEPLMESLVRATVGLDVGPMTFVIAIGEGVVFAFFGLLGGLLGGMLLGHREGPRDPLAGFAPEPPPPPLPPPAPGAGSPETGFASSEPSPDQPPLPWPPTGEASPVEPREPAASPEPPTIECDVDSAVRGPLPPDELPRLPPAPPPAGDGEPPTRES